MSGQVTITQLPVAGALTGTEGVPVVQNGVTVQTTTGAIAGAGALNYPFLTVGSTSGLSQARYIATGSGLTVTDNGAGNSLQINLIGAALSLDNANIGIIVKTGSTTVTNRLLTVGSGMTISNADGVADNPLIGLNANLQNLASLSGTGILAINGTSFTPFTLQGTTNQISIANGNAASGSPTISIYPNPILPGTGSVTIPFGTTAQRTGSNGALRYNTDSATFEAYANGAWGAIVSGSGVSTFSAGSTGLTPGTPTSGGITLAGILNASSGGTGVAGTLTGYVYGNGTGVMTASTTIPTTALSGTVTNAQLSNSAITINGNLVSLGGATTVTASTTSTLTIGTGLTGTSFNGSTPITIAIDSTVVTLTGSQTLTNKSMSGSSNTFTNIPNSALTNSSLTYNGVTVALGASGTITAVNPYALTFGTSLSGTSSTYNGSAAVTLNVANSGVTAGTYGSSAVIPVITVGADGRVTSVSTQATNAPAYQGTWNASTNTPTLTSSVGTAGYYYVVTTAGNTTLNGVSGWNVGDWAIFSNGAWQKIPGSTTESFTNLITTNLQIGGLTGFVYANNTTGYATAATTAQLLSLLGTTPVANGGTGLTSLTAGSLLYGNGTSAYNTLAIGTSGQILTSTGTAPQWSTLSGVAVTTFSGGTTGLTPSTATSGAITLGGTLAIANGGTGQTSFTAGYVHYGSFSTSANLQFDGTNLGIGVAPVSSKGQLQVGNIGYTDTGILAGFASSVAGYNQIILQNTNSGSTASTNFNVSNNNGTATTNFGEFGINSSGFTGTGAFSTAGNVYLAAATTDLAIGTYGSNAIHFVVNSGATDAMTIPASGPIVAPVGIAGGAF